MSDPCETSEVLTSTFLDQGLDREGQTRLLDHLARCSSCRRFYVEARALDGLVAAVAPRPDLEPAPEELWRRIEDRARPRPRAPERQRLTWALAAAAALAVGIALPFLPWSPGRPGGDGGTIEIVLEENRDAMTETRFVELTTELLQADRKYHFAMQDVMEAVIEGSWDGEESTSEGDVDEAGDDDGERSSRIRT